MSTRSIGMREIFGSSDSDSDGPDVDAVDESSPSEGQCDSLAPSSPTLILGKSPNVDEVD